MEKKVYYTVDNGDTPITCKLDAVMAMIEAETPNTEEQCLKDEWQWTIVPVWLTDEEFENLLEAD